MTWWPKHASFSLPCFCIIYCRQRWLHNPINPLYYHHLKKTCREENSDSYSCKGQQSRVLGTDYHISTFLCGPYLQIYDGTANSCSRERRLPGIHRRHICDSHQAFPKHSCKYGPYDHLMGSLSPKPFYGSISFVRTPLSKIDLPCPEIDSLLIKVYQDDST